MYNIKNDKLENECYTIEKGLVENIKSHKKLKTS